MPFEMLDNHDDITFHVGHVGEASHPHSILSRLGPSARENFGGRFGYGGAKKETRHFPFFFRTTCLD